MPYRLPGIACFSCSSVVVPLALQEGVDLLVATPGRVATLLEAEALSLEDCRAIVLDEVCPLPPQCIYNTIITCW